MAVQTDGTKYEILRALDRTHLHFQVGVNADFPGVVLPSHLKGEIALDFGRGLPISAYLDAGTETFGGELSFNRQPFAVQIPWGALLWASARGVIVAFAREAAPSPRPALSVVR